MIETINRLVRTSRQMLHEIGREPAPEELGMPLVRVRKVLKIAKEPISLFAAAVRLAPGLNHVALENSQSARCIVRAGKALKLKLQRSSKMPSVVEEFEFIARRANEIRAARYQELGVSPPAALPGQRQPSAEEEPPASSNGCGFKYAPEFQHLAGQSSSIDDWSCCVPA